LSSDYRYLVSGSQDKTLKLFEISEEYNDELVAVHHFTEAHKSSVLCVAISPNLGYVASGSAGKSIKVQSIAKKALFHNFRDTHKGNYDSI
jgi:WD40 repeat protein